MIICNSYFQESEISGGVRLCRTGVCIQCDAGLCKAFFHVSCAQANGLLSEPTYVTRNESMNMHSADAVMDAYLAHCKVHTGKVSMTSLLPHTVAQPTKWRFLPRNLSQLVIFVIELAFTWVWGDKNHQNLIFKVNFLCQKSVLLFWYLFLLKLLDYKCNLR